MQPDEYRSARTSAATDNQPWLGGTDDQCSDCKIQDTAFAGSRCVIAYRKKGTANAVSAKLPQLETNITNLEKELTDTKELLSQLTRTTATKPVDYEQQVTSLTEKIVDLRNKINTNKAQLAQYQFQFYQ